MYQSMQQEANTTLPAATGNRLNSTHNGNAADGWLAVTMVGVASPVQHQQQQQATYAVWAWPTCSSPLTSPAAILWSC